MASTILRKSNARMERHTLMENKSKQLLNGKSKQMNSSKSNYQSLILSRNKPSYSKPAKKSQKQPGERNIKVKSRRHDHNQVDTHPASTATKDHKFTQPKNQIYRQMHES